MGTTTEPDRTQAPPMTVQQWGEIEGPPHYDLVEGQLWERPDVPIWHQILIGNLFHFLGSFTHEHRLGMIVLSLAKLKISVYGGRTPDLFLIPTALDHLVGKDLFKGVPPLVVEILSPPSEPEDRGPKSREYAGLGIGEYWIIDFANRCLEVFRLRQTLEGNNYDLAETVTGEAVFRPSLFPGLEIPLSQVWPTEFEHRTDD